MTKPEDVPKSLVYDVYAQMKKCLELDELGTPVSTEQQIADLLNLCVEAGIVSPPCWNMRFNGELQRDPNGEPAVWPSRGLDSPDGYISYEPYRGQTE